MTYLETSALNIQPNRPSWDEYFMGMCDLVASRSPDPHTKIGAVIVTAENQILATGYNGLPSGVEITESRITREGGEKYFWFEHAERNAIFQCAKHGVASKGCCMYTHFLPCLDCSRAIVQAGIKTVKIDKLKNLVREADCRTRGVYIASYDRVKTLFKEAGVNFLEI